MYHLAINFLFECHAVICIIPKTREIIPAGDKSSLRSKKDPVKIIIISKIICNASECVGVNFLENNLTSTFVSYFINSSILIVLFTSNKKNIAQNVRNAIDNHHGNCMPNPSSIKGANPSLSLTFF